MKFICYFSSSPSETSSVVTRRPIRTSRRHVSPKRCWPRYPCSSPHIWRRIRSHRAVGDTTGIGWIRYGEFCYELGEFSTTKISGGGGVRSRPIHEHNELWFRKSKTEAWHYAISNAPNWTKKWRFKICPIGVVHSEYFRADAFGIFQLVSCVSLRNGVYRLYTVDV